MTKYTEHDTPHIKAFFDSDYNEIEEYIKNNNINLDIENKKIIQLNQTKQFINKVRNKNAIKNQHYVPQFYLKLFTNEDGKIETLNKDFNKIMKPQSVESVCSDTYFYAFETWKYDIVSQILEEFFWYYENNFSNIYQELVNNILRYNNIKQENIYTLCEFVTISRVRWKYFREELYNMTTNIKDKLHNELNIEIENIESENISNHHHIKFMTDEDGMLRFINSLFMKKIRIYIAKWERNFITSDCCVTQITPEYHWPMWVHFIERLHYFTLSPKILIEFSNPNNPWKKIKRKSIDDSEVMYYNLLLSIKWKHLYSKSKEDLIIDNYSKARANYIDRLHKIHPSIYEQDKNKINEFKELADKLWIKYKDNWELKDKVLNAINNINHY